MNAPLKPGHVVRMGGRPFRNWCDALLKAVANAADPTRHPVDLSVIDQNQEVREGRTAFSGLVEIADDDKDSG